MSNCLRRYIVRSIVPRLHTLVLKIGGGPLVDSERVLNQRRIDNIVELTDGLRPFVDHLLVVVGGAGAHFYIELARSYGAREPECDEIGVMVIWGDMTALPFSSESSTRLPSLTPIAMRKLLGRVICPLR